MIVTDREAVDRDLELVGGGDQRVDDHIAVIEDLLAAFHH